MANDEHVALLKQGVDSWNKWRDGNPDIRPDLDEADLSGAGLSKANLIFANLQEANLNGVVLSEANLYGANLDQANLQRANLSGAGLSQASLVRANLSGANLREANLREANLREANLRGANLSGAGLSGANLIGAYLNDANLSGANLRGANLEAATLVGTDLTGADFTGCRIYGVSAWGLKLEGIKQHNLIITRPGEPTVTVDNIEVAQFIYLLLHNEKIRDVIDTIGKKGVLLLGRFTDDRIDVLERLRGKLRDLGYLPMVFNFDKPQTKDFTETVRLLASLSKFIIVDITNPRSAPLELQATVPDYMVPFAPKHRNDAATTRPSKRFIASPTSRATPSWSPAVSANGRPLSLATS